jgi:hypothetical protein
LGRRTAIANSTAATIVELQELAGTLITASLSKATQNAYNQVWKKFSEFCKNCGKPEWVSVPVNPYSVILFLTSEFARGLTGASLASYSSALSYVHKIRGLPDPTNTFIVHKLILGAQKSIPRADIRLPITKPLLTRLILALSNSSLSLFAVTLLACLYSLAFHGFFRLGELIPHSLDSSSLVVQIQDVAVELPSRLSLILRHYKTNTCNTPFVISLCSTPEVSICPVRLTANFLEMRGYLKGPLFAYPSGTPITRHWFNTHFKNTLRLVGLDPSRFKGHSFRIGAATEAASSGLSDSQIRYRGRWRSDAFKSYIRIQ